MIFQIYDHDKPGEMKTVFEWERKKLYLKIPGKKKGHYCLGFTEDGGLEIQTTDGGALHIIPRVSNTIIVKPGDYA